MARLVLAQTVSPSGKRYLDSPLNKSSGQGVAESGAAVLIFGEGTEIRSLSGFLKVGKDGFNVYD